MWDLCKMALVANRLLEASPDAQTKARFLATLTKEAGGNLAAGNGYPYSCSPLPSSAGSQSMVSHHGDRYRCSCDPDLQRVEGQVISICTCDTINVVASHLYV